MNTHEFEQNGYKITTWVYDGDPERYKELWIHANGEYIGFIKFRGLAPIQEDVELYVEEYFSEMALGMEP